MADRSERRRGQMRSRSQREWRDATNPAGSAGPGQDPSDAEPDDAAAQNRATSPEVIAEGPDPDPGPTAAPGGGGATESADRTKEHEAIHGAASRKE